jgi:hypothetical protein
MDCGFVYGGKETRTIPYFHAGAVFGPFDSVGDVQIAINMQFPNEVKRRVMVFEGSFLNVQASPLEKPEAEKRAPGNMANYAKKAHDPLGFRTVTGYSCKTCGADILSATVAHPLHLKGTDGGFGECRYSYIPYCPNCDTEPSSHGAVEYYE